MKFRLIESVSVDAVGNQHLNVIIKFSFQNRFEIVMSNCNINYNDQIFWNLTCNLSKPSATGQTISFDSYSLPGIEIDHVIVSFATVFYTNFIELH